MLLQLKSAARSLPVSLSSSAIALSSVQFSSCILTRAGTLPLPSSSCYTLDWLHSACTEMTKLSRQMNYFLLLTTGCLPFPSPPETEVQRLVQMFLHPLSNNHINHITTQANPLAETICNVVIVVVAAVDLFAACYGKLRGISPHMAHYS